MAFVAGPFAFGAYAGACRRRDVVKSPSRPRRSGDL